VILKLTKKTLIYDLSGQFFYLIHFKWKPGSGGSVNFFVRIMGSGYFKNFKEPTLFMKDLTGFWHVR
jgi:hypothetical protein